MPALPSMLAAKLANKKQPVLSDEQRAAIEHLLSSRKRKQTLGGYAGTGKTTVIKELKKRLPTYAVCAFTGKAANVLRQKGVSATTIHSRIYKPIETQSKDGKGRKRLGVEFELRDREEVECGGFIVDEASMVNKEIHDDLCSFGLPIIFVGDHGQLEPVGGERFNLMLNPDITLEQIHRNAGEIARFAEFIRKGNEPSDWLKHEYCTGERVRLLTWDAVSQMQDDADQIICAFNKTRVELNQIVRDCYGYPPDRPAIGDRVMCLRNEHWLRVFNGMQGEIAELDLANERMTFRSDGKDYHVKFFRDHFNSNRRVERDLTLKGRLPFDYCYAITCHKAQGDEWEHVLVFEQRCRRWSHTRWAYTAASRARKILSWVPSNW